MSLSPPILFDPDKHVHLLPQISRIHIDCVLIDNTCLTFLPPLSTDQEGGDERVLQWWKSKLDDLRTNKRFLIVQLDEDKVAGYVMLETPSTETGPYRAVVQKLCVSQQYRRRGVARNVLNAMEKEAISRGRTLLMLDTTHGLPAVEMYPKLGWTLVGQVPEYATSPRTGERLTEYWFYKDLRKSAA